MDHSIGSNDVGRLDCRFPNSEFSLLCLVQKNFMVTNGSKSGRLKQITASHLGINVCSSKF